MKLIIYFFPFGKANRVRPPKETNTQQAIGAFSTYFVLFLFLYSHIFGMLTLANAQQFFCKGAIFQVVS